MWWSNFKRLKIILLTFIAVLSLTGCDKKVEDTFPFSQTEKMEVISYSERNYWDTIRNGKVERMGPIVLNKILQLDSSRIKERTFLGKEVKRTLFDILYRNTADEECTVASCFIPRHAILFYNKKMEIIGNLEVCFTCGTWESNFEHRPICQEELNDLQKIMKKSGIKYFGEGEH